jgi:hypothetical protein
MGQKDRDRGRMDRETLLKRAGVGAGVMALPAAFGVQSAFGLPPSGQRFYTIMSFSGAEATADIDFPRLLVAACGNFKPDAGWINGGGDWSLLDWPGGVGTATFIASGSGSQEISSTTRAFRRPLASPRRPSSTCGLTSRDSHWTCPCG